MNWLPTLPAAQPARNTEAPSSDRLLMRSLCATSARWAQFRVGATADGRPPLAFADAFELLGPALPAGAIVLVGGQALIYCLSDDPDRVEAPRDLAS